MACRRWRLWGMSKASGGLPSRISGLCSSCMSMRGMLLGGRVRIPYHRFPRRLSRLGLESSSVLWSTHRISLEFHVSQCRFIHESDRSYTHWRTSNINPTSLHRGRCPTSTWHHHGSFDRRRQVSPEPLVASRFWHRALPNLLNSVFNSSHRSPR